MRAIAAILGLAVLGACAAEAPQAPGRGLGYSDYQLYEIERARREAALRGLAPLGGVAADTVNPGALAPVGGVTTADLAAAGIGPAAPVTTQPLGAPLPTTAAVQPSNATGLSDEQNFDAVASRESIESDAERLRQAAANYQVVQPTALPQRQADAGPNIVEYALAAPNNRGQEWYSRSIVSVPGRFSRNCASYGSPDEAQRDFLARGGPERDPTGIDPDGDGFACGWDPAPFRAAVGRG